MVHTSILLKCYPLSLICSVFRVNNRNVFPFQTHLNMCRARQVVWDTQHHLWSLNCRFHRLSATGNTTSWWRSHCCLCVLIPAEVPSETVLTEFCSERKTVTDIVIWFPILVFQIVTILVIFLCLQQSNMFSNIFSIIQYYALAIWISHFWWFCD